MGENMNKKFIFKMILDALMTIALFFTFGFQFWGENLHEVFGTLMILMFILHQVLNLNWYKNLFNGKYTALRITGTVLNILLLADFFILAYSGIAMSRYVFAPLNLEWNVALSRRLHILGSYWGFVLMSAHLGLHWNIILAAIKKALPVKQNKSKIKAIACFVISLCVALYGVTVFFRRSFLTYMLLKSEFVFMDFEEPKTLFYLDHISLMITFVFLFYYGKKMLFKRRK